MRVTGRILFGADAEVFSGGSAHVTIEDTTSADALAVEIGSWHRADVAYPRDASGIPFEIVLPAEPPPNRRLTLRVLVDVRGNGTLRSGDYMNVESIPVPPGGGTVDVPVKRYR